MSENENKENCTRAPYMRNGGYMAYPDFMWGMPRCGFMWQNSFPMRCPMCGGFIPMGGVKWGEEAPFPESE